MRKPTDVNVILRHLLGDHPQVLKEARQVIEDGVLTLSEVIAEVVYVLKGAYHIERDKIRRTLAEFLDEMFVGNQDATYEVLSLFSETSLDFADCVLIARHRMLGDGVVSFDKRLNEIL